MLISVIRTRRRSHCEWIELLEENTDSRYSVELALITHLRGESYFSIPAFFRISREAQETQSLLRRLADKFVGVRLNLAFPIALIITQGVHGNTKASLSILWVSKIAVRVRFLLFGFSLAALHCTMGAALAYRHVRQGQAQRWCNQRYLGCVWRKTQVCCPVFYERRVQRYKDKILSRVSSHLVEIRALGDSRFRATLMCGKISIEELVDRLY
jgi:hypothetical protein